MAQAFDVVVVGGTPGGLMAAIAAAREGATALVLERTAHIGGLPANGLGATDIATRGGTGGLFQQFVNRIRAFYVQQYGEKSPQVADCSDGYHFEPSVAEKVLEQMLAEHAGITVLRGRQFDSDAKNVVLQGRRLTQITVTDRATGKHETYSAGVFIDATYEGDLAAAAGVPFRTDREGFTEFAERMAGRIYRNWGVTEAMGEGSTGEADSTLQAFNYRLCLTSRADNRVPVARPPRYNRDEYVSLIDDVRLNRYTGPIGREMHIDGIGRLTNMVTLPNGKTDANNQHLAFISTDLPVENYPWPTADWAWRDRFAVRLREYIQGLLYFAQNDAALPADFRAKCGEWGFAADEYLDNGNFPRQVYVREGRRMQGEHLFTANDALPVRRGSRPPVYAGSITASHYALDSHAVRPREPDRVHLDGFFSYPTQPYTVPFGVMLPKQVDGLLFPVPVCGTHVGFSTLRMEPCWMALGEAAGLAAAMCIRGKTEVREVHLPALQGELVRHGAVLIYFADVPPGHAAYAAVQHFGLKGMLPDWSARPAELVTAADAQAWCTAASRTGVECVIGKTTRGELLARLHQP